MRREHGRKKGENREEMNKRKILVEPAYEMTFDNETICVISEGGKKEERTLNGVYLVSSAFGIPCGEYMVYFKYEDLSQPCLILDMNTGNDVNGKVEYEFIPIKNGKGIASYDIPEEESEYIPPLTKEKSYTGGIASLYL